MITLDLDDYVNKRVRLRGLITASPSGEESASAHLKCITSPPRSGKHEWDITLRFPPALGNGEGLIEEGLTRGRYIEVFGLVDGYHHSGILVWDLFASFSVEAWFLSE